MGQKTWASSLVTLSVYTPPPTLLCLELTHHWRLYKHSCQTILNFSHEFYGITIIFCVTFSSWFKNTVLIDTHHRVRPVLVYSVSGFFFALHPAAHMALPLHEIFIESQKNFQLSIIRPSPQPTPPPRWMQCLCRSGLENQHITSSWHLSWYIESLARPNHLSRIH